ncbi:MAG: endolytic transglycosylase MltG, partial [Pseudomonadota bacterium]
VLLERGSGPRDIAQTLKDAGLVRNPNLFLIAVKALGASRDLKAGEYDIAYGSSLRDVIAILRNGRSVLRKITVPEGVTSAQIVRLLTENEMLVGELPDALPEGVLHPETYHFARGTERQDLIERMRSAQTAILDEAWANRAQGLPIATKEEALVLASIVEKETGVAEERPLVAAVFINRLRKGMRLQSDPTIIYGITGGEPLGRGIRRSEIDRKTAYNTYQIDGLPPTPIANPGKAAIEAVLNPPSTTDFYFVADGTGGHVFAQTLAQHQKNVANWRKIEKARKAARRTTN